VVRTVGGRTYGGKASPDRLACGDARSRRL